MTTAQPSNGVICGAEFSKCRKYRYSLWRIWDTDKPLVMVVGLNPSTANENTDDPTIRSISRIANSNGFGGVCMMNCFAFISTDPDLLEVNLANALVENVDANDVFLEYVAEKCSDVVFAWGSFPIVKESGRDIQLSKMFPNAKCLAINKNGSPKHPLYCKSDTQFIEWKSPANDNQNHNLRP